MAGFSTYLETKIMQWMVKRQQLPTPPTTVQISLHSLDPGDTGANELASSGAYARVTMTTDTDDTAPNAVNWNVTAADGTAWAFTNKLPITFPQATADWFSGNPITFAGIWDAGGTNFLATCSITPSGVVVLNGNTLSFTGGTPGQLKFKVD